MLLSSWFFISIFSHNYHSYPWTNLVSVVPVNWKPSPAASPWPHSSLNKAGIPSKLQLERICAHPFSCQAVWVFLAVAPGRDGERLLVLPEPGRGDCKYSTKLPGVSPGIGFRLKGVKFEMEVSSQQEARLQKLSYCTYMLLQKADTQMFVKMNKWLRNPRNEMCIPRRFIRL